MYMYRLTKSDFRGRLFKFGVSPDQKLNTILRLPSVLYYINKVFLVSAFLKEVLAGARGLRLLTHRFPTRMLGRLGLFACFTLSHTPSGTFARFVGFAGITTVSQSPYGVCSPRVLSSFFPYPIPEQYAMIHHDISPSLEAYVRASLPRPMSPTPRDTSTL